MTQKFRLRLIHHGSKKFRMTMSGVQNINVVTSNLSTGMSTYGTHNNKHNTNQYSYQQGYALLQLHPILHSFCCCIVSYLLSQLARAIICSAWLKCSAPAIFAWSLCREKTRWRNVKVLRVIIIQKFLLGGLREGLILCPLPVTLPHNARLQLHRMLQWNLFITVTLGTMAVIRRWPAYRGWWCTRIVLVDGVWHNYRGWPAKSGGCQRRFHRITTFLGLLYDV